MLKSTGAMGAATLTSRILGMVREMFYSHFMGDTPVASAFKLAFQIPNLFRRLLGEGALTVAFIPIFKLKEKTAGQTEMWRAANAVISGLIVVSAAIIGLVMLGITIALSVHSFGANTVLMLRLLRLMFPYMLMVCLAAIFMGMLNARGRFFIPALGAAVLNLVMIASVVFLAPHWGNDLHTQIFALAVGVLMAGTAQTLFQLPNLRSVGFRYAWVSPWKNDTVREVVRKMLPGTIGVAAFQINVLVTGLVANWVDKRMYASFDYAVRLMELPQGVFGISLATFLLPTLTGLAIEKKYPEFRNTLAQGLNHLIFINLLASILLFVLADPIIRLIFEHGRFTPASTARAAWALTFLAPGLVAFSVVNILARGFYALGDTKTPMKISMVCFGVNLIFALLFVGPLRQGGLGLANSLSAVFNMFLLFFALRKKMKFLELAEFRRNLVPLFFCAAAAGVSAWFANRFWVKFIGHETIWDKIGAAFVPIILSAAVYFSFAMLLKVPSAREILAFLLSKLGKPKF
ncbi:MAG: murein biosynthesis integral membrane protein MurJ [Verrucomicrobiota bacterium]